MSYSGFHVKYIGRITRHGKQFLKNKKRKRAKRQLAAYAARGAGGRLPAGSRAEPLRETEGSALSSEAIGEASKIHLDL